MDHWLSCEFAFVAEDSYLCHCLLDSFWSKWPMYSASENAQSNWQKRNRKLPKWTNQRLFYGSHLYPPRPFLQVAPKQPRQRRAGQGQPHCYVAAQRLVSSVGHWHFTRRLVVSLSQAVLENTQIEGMKNHGQHEKPTLHSEKKNSEKNPGENLKKQHNTKKIS